MSTNDINSQGNCNDISEDEENEDNYMSSNGNPYDQIEEVKGVISVQKMNVELSDLFRDEFIIVSIYDHVSKKDCYF